MINKNIRVKFYKKAQFLDFCADAKDGVEEREGSTRIDEIKVISASGKFTQGVHINTPARNKNLDTVAVRVCSYILEKKSIIFAENHIRENVTIMIYDGYATNNDIKEQFGLKNKDEFTIFDNLDLFLERCYNETNRFTVNGNYTAQYGIYISNELLYTSDVDKDCLKFGYKTINKTYSDDEFDIYDPLQLSKEMRKPVYTGDKSSVVVIKQTLTMMVGDKSQSKVKYFMYNNDLGGLY